MLVGIERHLGGARKKGGGYGGREKEEGWEGECKEGGESPEYAFHSRVYLVKPN